jgi:hypothetical protein
MKREPGAWGYNWATLFLGDINTGSGPPGWWLDAKLTTLLFGKKKKKIVTKSKEVKQRYNWTESSKEGCGSKRAVLPMFLCLKRLLRYHVRFYRRFALIMQFHLC